MKEINKNKTFTTCTSGQILKQVVFRMDEGLVSENTEPTKPQIEGEAVRAQRKSKTVRDDKMKKIAFTLAEVLITVGIVGLVAALVVPSFMTYVRSKVRAEQVRTVKYKFTKATEQMNVQGLIVRYASTEDFINELKNYLKIQKVCSNENLKECWPYEKTTLTDGTKYDVSNISDGRSFKRTKGDWSSPVMGIITGDGNPILLTYRKDCEPLDSTMQYPWSTSGGKPVTNATTNCVSAIFEINGAKGENQFKKDVNAFNANGLGNDCAVGVPMGNKCFSEIHPPTYVTRAKCREMQETGLYGNLKCSNLANGKDYWAGAAIACGGVDNLPTEVELRALASKVYGKNISRNTTNTNVNYDSEKAQELGLPAEPGYTVWANERNGVEKSAYLRCNQNEVIAGTNATTDNFAVSYMCVLD